MPFEFEWDAMKSLGNLWKHGALLSSAPELWHDPRLKITRGRAKLGESRFYAYGLYQNQIWKAVFALRSGKIRLISFYPAPRRERHAYLGRGV